MDIDGLRQIEANAQEDLVVNRCRARRLAGRRGGRAWLARRVLALLDRADRWILAIAREAIADHEDA